MRILSPAALRDYLRESREQPLVELDLLRELSMTTGRVSLLVGPRSSLYILPKPWHERMMHSGLCLSARLVRADQRGTWVERAPLLVEFK